MQTTEPNLTELWAEYDQTGDESLRNVLVEHYIQLVDRIVSAITRKNPRADFDELKSSGMIGLMQAVEAFNPDKGILFETFAGYRIRGAIADDLRETDIVPRLVRVRQRIRNNATERLTKELGRPPSNEEVYAAIGQVAYEDSEAVAFNSLDFVVGHTDTGKTETAGENIRDRVAPPHDNIDRKDWLAGVTAKLSREEKLAVTLYYVEGMTMKEIGEVIGYSESRVSQLMTSIRLRLRETVKQ